VAAAGAETDVLLRELEPELVALRRDLHTWPEVGRQEHRTTRGISEVLSRAGLSPTALAVGTGLVCDIGTEGPLVVLRADLDALPLQDVKDVPYRSQVPGVCHACGHDVHIAAVVGAGLALAGQQLPGRVRLVFQPAEELLPGGALDVVAEGWLDEAVGAFALHCDPSLDVGRIGIKEGAITASADAIDVHVSGPGGHTSRPQNTVDLVHATAAIATGLPEALSRLVDPRAGLCLVFGHISAGDVRNAIPREALLSGTLRVLDTDAWERAPELVETVARQLAAPFGAAVSVAYLRGVPPVVNDAFSTGLMRQAVVQALGPEAVAPTGQSLGGEDFAWFLQKVPGCMARLGVRTPGSSGVMDLHQPSFDVDERAIGIGARVLVECALQALRAASGHDRASGG
jgi:amidohydrolase